MYDCHMHTKLSTDSVMDADEACETAIRIGLEGVAFTDHLDYDFPGQESFLVDFEKYFRMIEELRGKYGDRLKVLSAVEAGLQPHVIDRTQDTIRTYPFDYVLASVHIVKGEDPYEKAFYSGRTKKEAYSLYLEAIYKMIGKLESFDMVGHLGFVIRNADYDDRTLRYSDHSDLLDMIFKELIDKGRGFELNTGTYRDMRPDAEYDLHLLKRYRELGGELICLGSDAHQARHIAIHFDYFAHLLRDAGFEYTVHFENRKPVFDKL
ncbi:MAG: histidinol-phosphatase HisJ family protein [Acetivibrionales bacterium]